MRRLITFSCAGETLVGTLDEVDGPTGLLIVSGGNEIRCGAHRGMAMLAAALAERGIPVFRYDRRGIGDSSGVNAGYVSAGPDLAAALAAFRAAVPGMTRVAGFGNCDAATTLALSDHDLDSLILANPWIDAAGDDGLPPTAAIRARYAARARDPETWLRLLRGGINLRNVGRGIGKLLRDRARPTTIAGMLAQRLNTTDQPLTILIATGDATGMAFEDALRSPAFAAVTGRARVIRIATASHSFAHQNDKRALTDAVVNALR